jgi:iron(III) transport system permease protein
MEKNLRDNSMWESFLGKLPKIILIVFILWFIVTFLIYPEADTIINALWTDGSINTEAFQKILNSERAMNAIRNSVVLAVVLTFTCNILGVFLVLVTDYFEIKGAWLLRIAFMSTLLFGGLILNNGYLFLYGENGIITNLLVNLLPGFNEQWFRGFPAVLIVMTFGCTHSHMIFLRNSINNLDNNVINAAKNLGASQWEIIRQIVFPSLRPVMITLIIIIFSTGLNAFAAPLMVGGTEFQTISPLILTFAQRPGSQDLAALLSVFLGITQVVLLTFLTLNERKSNYRGVSKTQTRFQKQKIKNKPLNIIMHVLAYILFIIYILPPIMIVLFSFMETRAITYSEWSLSSFTLEHYINILTNPSTYQPLLRSILYSGVAAVGVVLFMLLVVRLVMRSNNRFIQSLELPFYIPWLLPAILVALGYVLSYDSPSALLFGQSVIGATWIIPIAYAVIVMPITIRYIKSAYYSFDSNLEDASKNLGASNLRTFFQIIVPALLPTLLALVALNFNSNLAEYNMSAFLYQPGHETLGVVIQQNSSPAQTVDAQAINLVYSVITMIISAICLYIIYGRGTKLGERRGGFIN